MDLRSQPVSSRFPEDPFGLGRGEEPRFAEHIRESCETPTGHLRDGSLHHRTNVLFGAMGEPAAAKRGLPERSERDAIGPAFQLRDQRKEPDFSRVRESIAALDLRRGRAVTLHSMESPEGLRKEVRGRRAAGRSDGREEPSRPRDIEVALSVDLLAHFGAAFTGKEEMRVRVHEARNDDVPPQRPTLPSRRSETRRPTPRLGPT